MRRGVGLRVVGLAAALALAAGSVGAWEIRAPVVAAEPVYDAASQIRCSVPAAGPVQSADLVAVMAEDLDLAVCAPSEPAIVGWTVRYRVDGREYRTFTVEHPGATLAVKVRVQSASSSSFPPPEHLPATRKRIRR